MIDTVKFRIGGEWKSDLQPVGWKRQTMVRNRDGRTDRSCLYLHESSGLRILGGEDLPNFIEVSLPRALYGTNGHLLDAPAEIPKAVGRVLDIASRVVKDPTPGRLTRLDTVWQYRGEPAQWVTALGSARHPAIRSEPRRFFGQSVEWVGTNVCLRVYDKLLEQGGGPGDVVRVEVQMRGKVLKNLLPATGETPEELQWQGCWEVYRAMVTALPAFKVWDKSRPLSLAGFLALLHNRNVKIDELPAEEVLFNCRSLRTQRRLRAQMAAAGRQELLNVSPAELLPLEGPPEAVHVAAA